MKNRKTAQNTSLAPTSKRRITTARARRVANENGLVVARFLALASDPVDGLMALWDLTNLHLHESTARILRARGSVPGPAPLPVSRLMTGFWQQLKDKTEALGQLLDASEIERLSRAAPAFLAALKANDLDVFRIICELMPHAPEVIAAWLRVNIDWIERRFAS